MSMNTDKENKVADKDDLVFPSERMPEKASSEFDLLRPVESRLNRKEKYAGILATGMLILFVVEVLIYIAAAFFLPLIDNLNTVYQVVFPVTVGFLGSAVTYYHNHHSR